MHPQQVKLLNYLTDPVLVSLRKDISKLARHTDFPTTIPPEDFPTIEIKGLIIDYFTKYQYHSLFFYLDIYRILLTCTPAYDHTITLSNPEQVINLIKSISLHIKTSRESCYYASLLYDYPSFYLAVVNSNLPHSVITTELYSLGISAAEYFHSID